MFQCCGQLATLENWISLGWSPDLRNKPPQPPPAPVCSLTLRGLVSTVSIIAKPWHRCVRAGCHTGRGEGAFFLTCTHKFSLWGHVSPVVWSSELGSDTPYPWMFLVDFLEFVLHRMFVACQALNGRTSPDPRRGNRGQRDEQHDQDY